MIDRTSFRARAVLSVFLTSSAVALVAEVSPATAQRSAAPPDPAALGQMYGSGVGFDVFLANAERRKERWDANWRKSAPSGDLVARARALDSRYRLLVVAVDSCSDSVNTIPYIAGLVNEVDELELQIVDSDVGRAIMNTYRTPDDRGATPTVVILDDDYEVVGAWVERPSALQEWWIGNPQISAREKSRRKQGWYDWDEGAQTLAEILALLEAADAG